MYQVKVRVTAQPPKKSFWHDQRLLELVAGKLPRDKTGRFNSVKEMKLTYVATEGGAKNLRKIDLRSKLEGLASFSTVANVKVVARLAHLQSDSHGISFISASKIEFIEERGNEGCGFLPSDFFRGTATGVRRGYDALQVRIMGPKVGLAKGMLLVKVSGRPRVFR